MTLQETLAAATDALERANDLIRHQAQQIEDLKKRVATFQAAAEILPSYVRAVHNHNVRCVEDCNDGLSCGYHGFLKRTGRRCPGCPAEFKVDVMPSKGSA